MALYHGRGRDELVHRALKDFGFEQLPFQRFMPNTAFYYVLAITFFLFEAFKRDVAADLMPPTAFATRLRRRLIDVAGKLVRSGRQVLLKVTAAAYAALGWEALWARSAAPPGELCWS